MKKKIAQMRELKKAVQLPIHYSANWFVHLQWMNLYKCKGIFVIVEDLLFRKNRNQWVLADLSTINRSISSIHSVAPTKMRQKLLNYVNKSCWNLHDCSFEGNANKGKECERLINIWHENSVDSIHRIGANCHFADFMCKRLKCWKTCIFKGYGFFGWNKKKYGSTSMKTFLFFFFWIRIQTIEFNS